MYIYIYIYSLYQIICRFYQGISSFIEIMAFYKLSISHLLTCIIKFVLLLEETKFVDAFKILILSQHKVLKGIHCEIQVKIRSKNEINLNTLKL